MSDTRQDILDYLQRYHTATVEEFSRVLSLTRPNIRHHLNLLIGQGMVKEAGQIPPGGRGRPTLVYMLVPSAQREGMEQMVSALLDEVNAEKNDNARQQRLHNLAARLQRDEVDPGQSTTLRLNAAVQRLNQLHYQAHWEARATGPQVILGQCPYAAILPHHPELCQIDRYLIEDMGGRPVKQVEKIAAKPEGPHMCRFVVR
jgi:predicted ArsR family transcriptional regulator